MTVIRPNSISGITSITSHQNDVAFYKSDGSGANINNISINSPSGIITSANFKNASTDVHSIGIDVGSNIKIGTGGIITATSFDGSGANLTSIPAGNLTGTVADARISTLTASKLTGALPAIDGSQLTGISAGVGTADSVNTSGIITATAIVSDFAPRNMIINGAMQINQRGSGTLTINSSSSQYPCDRWVSRGEGGSKAFTIEKTSIASSGQGVRNALKVTSSQAASVGSNDIFNVRQMIEGYNIQRLNLGEAGCASMALSFTAYSSVAGTHSGAIQNSAQNRSYPFTYTLAQNTWTDVKITIPPITSGSFNETNGVGLRVVFDLGCGNGFRGTAGQWNTAQDEGATGAVRILETNGATWYVTKVQLEEGAVATPYEKKLVGEELRNCCRYYQKDLNRRAYWGSGNVSDRQFPVRFGVEMRDTPTISFYSTSIDSGSAQAYNKTRQGYNFAMTGSGRFYEWAHTASAEL